MNCLVCANGIIGTFYSSVGHKGDLEIYCFACYSKNVLDNYPYMNEHGTLVSGEKCECGTKAGRGQNHSHWCCFYRSEF